MTNIDTLKVRIRLTAETFDWLDKSRFGKGNYTSPAKSEDADAEPCNASPIRYVLPESQKQRGLCGLRVTALAEDLTVGWVDVELNSKILLGKSHLLINKETLPMVIESLNNNDAFQFNEKFFMENAEVRKIHVTQDLKPSVSPMTVISVLSSMELLVKPQVDARWKTTVYFYARAVVDGHETARRLLTVYDKQQAAKADRPMSGIVDDKVFEGVVRFEQELDGIRKIRRAFNIDYQQVLLTDILNSDENPIYSTFNSIIAQSKLCRVEDEEFRRQADNIILDTALGISETEKRLGRLLLLNFFGKSRQRIINYVSSKERDRSTIHLHVKAILGVMGQGNQNELDEERRIIDELLALLKV